jgi:hypothetical protein
MPIYKFDTLEIENPEITVFAVRDLINEGRCEVEVALRTPQTFYTTTLFPFEYKTTWEDVDVINWVINKLQEYAI